jgi:glycosyltransferase involved in cell wall biosynthesis
MPEAGAEPVIDQARRGNQEEDVMPMLSICVPTYNRADLLQQALEDLRFLHDCDFDSEVVIFDNASTDKTEEVVRNASAQLPSVRYYRQKENVGAAANSAAVHQMARGDYTLYLADDDRLIPDNLSKLVGHLQEHQDMVACYVPWILWNPQDGTRRPFYHVDEIRVFDKISALDCFNFVVQRGIFPEIAIFRTEILHKLFFQPHHVYLGYDFLFKALRYGSVCFHPDSYYLSVIRTDGGVSSGDRGQVGHEQAISHLDQYRGGLEAALMIALEELVPLPLQDNTLISAMTMVNEFVRARLDVASRLSRAKRDFIGAYEFQIRSLLWNRNGDVAGFRQQSEQELLVVALQAIAERFHHNSIMETLVLCDCQSAEQLLRVVQMFLDESAADARSMDQVLDAGDRESLLVVVDSEAARARLLGDGFLPGNAVCIQDVMRNFQVMPRAGVPGTHRAAS